MSCPATNRFQASSEAQNGTLQSQRWKKYDMDLVTILPTHYNPYGGRLILDLLETGEYVLANSSDKMEGGPWTWISRSDSTVKSCIDLVIMSADLAPFLRRIRIDQKKEFAPARARMVNGRKKLIYSDHHPIIIEFENLPKGWIAKDKQSSWNRNKPGGWEQYKNLTEIASKKMDVIIQNNELTNEEVAEKLENVETKIKFQAFGKTKPPSKLKVTRRMKKEASTAQRLDSEEVRVSKIFKKQCQEIEDDINILKAGKCGKVTNVFKMAEIIGGAKKLKEEAHSIVDPETKDIVVATEEIKRVSLAHCVRVLQNNPVKPEAELWVKVESEVHEAMMTKETDKEDNINWDDFKDVINKFKSKNKPAYHFLTKAGESFQKSIYKLCRRFIQDENFPSKFSETVLKQLWKRKGSR